MRVGIITEPLLNNYGGILQNYALQQALIRLGHKPVTLDYMPSLSFGRYLLYLAKNLLLYPVPSRRKPIKVYRHFVRRPAHFESFVSSHIKHSEMLERYTRRVAARLGADAFVVGSDQVWRKEYNLFIEDMFLAFTKKLDCRRIAYAASFGVEKWNYSPELTLSCSRLAAAFDAVSVREQSGKKLCSEHLGVDAQVVLDPTLLLGPENYDRLLPDTRTSGRKYVAAYVLDIDDEKKAFIESVARYLDAEVRFMTVSDKCECTIEDWLSTIRNASFVVTDSYHGSVFSIIYNRQFATFLNKGRGADRFNTLFGKLDLDSRIIERGLQPLELANREIDYQKVNETLIALKKESLDFLSRSLE